MADLFAGQPIPVEEKVAELRRELRQREHVYPRLVASGKLKQDRVDRQVAVLQAILDDYEQLLASARREVSMGADRD